MAKMTLNAPMKVGDRTRAAGTSVEVAEPRPARLAERGRAVYAEAAPVNRAELAAGRPELDLPEHATGSG